MRMSSSVRCVTTCIWRMVGSYRRGWWAPNGPADRAGLRAAERGQKGGIVPGDVIQGLATRPVRNGADLRAALDDFEPGAEVELKVWREGRVRKVPITLGAP